jgi:hypothetical protein
MAHKIRTTALSLLDLWMKPFPDAFIPTVDQVLPCFVVMLQRSAAPAVVQAQTEVILCLFSLCFKC